MKKVFTLFLLSITLLITGCSSGTEEATKNDIVTLSDDELTDLMFEIGTYRRRELDLEDRQYELDRKNTKNENDIERIGKLMSDVEAKKQSRDEELAYQEVEEPVDEYNESDVGEIWGEVPMDPEAYDEEYYDEYIYTHTDYLAGLDLQTEGSFVLDGELIPEFYHDVSETYESGYVPMYHITKILAPDLYSMNQNEPYQGDWSFEIADGVFNRTRSKYFEEFGH